MSDHRLEVADVFRQHETDFFDRWEAVLAPCQKKPFRAIINCRTAVSYNSCRDRHCPKCQATTRAKWLAQRETELLPVEYFHVVFTLPQQIGEIAMQNAREIYCILFRAASETLLTIAADPKHLGAVIGFLAVLHTWGQNLHVNPHS
jgi:Transposase zinc-binding domain